MRLSTRSQKPLNKYQKSIKKFCRIRFDPMPLWIIDMYSNTGKSVFSAITFHAMVNVSELVFVSLLFLRTNKIVQEMKYT